jgi:hypothetical protein
LEAFSDSFQKEVQPLSEGSFVVLLEGFEDELDQKLVATMWKCRGDSVDSLVAKVEIEALLAKLDAIKEADEAS